MYQIPETAVVQKVGEELVILDMESGNYFGLDEVGARMVDLINQHGEPKKVVGMMVEEYDASHEQIRSDLDSLLEELVSHNLLNCTD